MKAALIRTFLVGLILGSYLCAQTFNVEKPKTFHEKPNLPALGTLLQTQGS
jgi:hypothetical protein